MTVVEIQEGRNIGVITVYIYMCHLMAGLVEGFAELSHFFQVGQEVPEILKFEMSNFGPNLTDWP